MEKTDEPIDYEPHSMVASIRQSPPINLNEAYNEDWVRGRTIVITGGASGFGEGMVRKWAANGANVVVGDINVEQGEQVVNAARKSTSNENVHFIRTDVTSWESQVALFKEAAKLSHHGGIDAVVANAGISGVDNFEVPQGLDGDAPPKPNLKTYEVNLTGVLYTAHLALFWLPRNPGSKAARSSREPEYTPRDRHLLLIGSMASLGPIPTAPLYGVAKHGVLGLFRSLRATAWLHGIRINLVCPYFIDTPIVPAIGRALVAGGGLGKVEDVVDAANRFTADNSIVGRALYVGPKMKVVLDKEKNYQLALGGEEGVERAVWECYAHDYDDTEQFNRNLIRLLNQFAAIRGWTGWLIDMVKAVIYGARNGPRALVGGRPGGRRR